jgi:hypothetical protein
MTSPFRMPSLKPSRTWRSSHHSPPQFQATEHLNANPRPKAPQPLAAAPSNDAVSALPITTCRQAVQDFVLPLLRVNPPIGLFPSRDTSQTRSATSLRDSLFISARIPIGFGYLLRCCPLDAARASASEPAPTSEFACSRRPRNKVFHARRPAALG